MQIKFFAEQEQLYVDTAKVLGEKKGSAAALRKDISLKAKKGLPAGSIDVLAKQPTRVEAAKLANTFVKQLAIYANQQLASQYNSSVKQAQAAVTSLESQLALVNAQIAQLTTKSKKGSTTPKTKPPTTTTTAPTTTTTARTTTTTAAHHHDDRTHDNHDDCIHHEHYGTGVAERDYYDRPHYDDRPRPTDHECHSDNRRDHRPHGEDEDHIFDIQDHFYDLW